MKIDVACGVVVLLSGVLLIACGVAQVFLQGPIQIGESQSISLDAPTIGKLAVGSRYPGITMIVVGAVLQISAFSLTVFSDYVQKKRTDVTTDKA